MLKDKLTNLKTIAVAAIVAGSILTFGGGAFASSGEVPRPVNGAGELISEDQGLISTETDKAGKSITSGEVGSGTTTGYWIRGKKNINGQDKVYSSYKNYKKMGHASVVNGEGDYESGGWRAPNTFSTAYVKWTFWGTNKAYYDYR